MPVDDRTRLNLHRKLDAVLGREEADTLMAHLPPVTWNDVATKHDIRTENMVLRNELRVEMAGLGTELRTEMAGLGTELRTEIAELRTEMHVGFADLRTEIANGTNRQIRWMVTFAAAWSSLLVAAVRLIP